MEPHLESLTQIDAAIWRELASAARDRRHEWHTPVLATTDGTTGDARVVVLREVLSEERCCVFYSDSRAGKLEQLRSHPDGTLVLWSPRLCWQLRLRSRFTAETDGLAVASRWAQLKLLPTANDYLSTLPPGTPLDEVLAAAQAGRADRAHFAVVTAQVLSVDWLELLPHGHRRAVFSGGQGRWVQA